jgi:hypothetical protein
VNLSKLQFAGAVALLLLAGFAASASSAQRRMGRSRGQRPGPPPRSEQRPAQRQQNLAGLPPKWVGRLREMSPEEQERFMRNNARFQDLPPDRQAQIRQNLQRWNRMTPEQRNELRDRDRILEQMSPEQREYVRTQLLPRWQELPQGRKQVIRDRLRELRGLSEAERQSRLSDPAFLHGLDPREQQVLRDLSNLRIGAGEP